MVPVEGTDGMATTTDTGGLVISTPGIRGGRPRIAGTGVTVQRIVCWYRLGLDADEIADRVGHLSLAQVHAALAYYYANRDAIDGDIAADEAEADAVERELLSSHREAETRSNPPQGTRNALWVGLA